MEESTPAMGGKVMSRARAGVRRRVRTSAGVKMGIMMGGNLGGRRSLCYQDWLPGYSTGRYGIIFINNMSTLLI